MLPTHDNNFISIHYTTAIVVTLNKAFRFSNYFQVQLYNLGHKYCKDGIDIDKETKRPYAD